MGAAERSGLPLSVWIVLLTWFSPQTLALDIFGLRLTPARIAFIVLTPIVFARFFQKLGSGRYRFVWSDICVPAASFWMFLGPGVLYGLPDTLVHTGPDVLEFLIPYLVTRVMIRENGQTLSFVNVLTIVIACISLDGTLDTLSDQYITRGLATTITGVQPLVTGWGVEDAHRFGLLRAAGPTEHPILFGFIACVGLLFAVWVKIRARIFCIAACSVGLIISFSSAPQQCAVLGIGLLIYGRLMGGLKSKWLIIIIGIALCLTTLFLVTDRPFGLLLSIVTINPSTGYYRLYIWNVVGPPILDSPYFGVIRDAVDYNGSVDSLWLVESLRYGMPCSILTALSLIGCCSLGTAGPDIVLLNSESRVGTVLGVILALTIYMAFTVNFWGTAWILVGLLTGLRAHLGELAQLNR